MRLMYFTDRVIGQLKELRKSTAQRAIGHATCVLTHSKLYSGIFEMLESTRMVKVTAGDDAGPRSNRGRLAAPPCGK